VIIGGNWDRNRFLSRKLYNTFDKLGMKLKGTLLMDVACILSNA